MKLPYIVQWCILLIKRSCIFYPRLKWFVHVRGLVTIGTCTGRFNGHETTWKKRKRKTEDRVHGCCGQRHENGGTGPKDGGRQKTMAHRWPLRWPQNSQMMGQAGGKEELCTLLNCMKKLIVLLIHVHARYLVSDWQWHWMTVQLQS